MKKSKFVTGYIINEEELLSAVKSLKLSDVIIEDIRSPYPIHGLDKVMEFKPSNISKVAFWAGTISFIGTLGLQVFISSVVYPINYGGKPFASIPSFMPITLMVTFLVTIVSIAVAFFIQSKLGPGASIEILNEGATDDQFQIIVSGEAGVERLTALNFLDIREVEIK